MTDRVLAVFVCYNPQPGPLAVSLKAIQAQADSVLLVDNGSDNLNEIESLVEQNTADITGVAEPVKLLKLNQNLGLGAAHNVGISQAKAGNYSHVLLLDQDSVPLTGMVAGLLQACSIKQDKGKLSAVGATYLNADNGSESFFIRFGKLKFQRSYCASRDDDGCIEADFLISSGSLFPIEVFDEIGDMDESLFIDHVDTEWFLRARNKGYTAFGVCDAVMQHGLGEQTHRVDLSFNSRLFNPQNWGVRQRNVPQHKPFRYYYIFRNSVILYKRSYTSALWKWNDIQRLAMIAIMFGLIKPPRWQNLKMMVRGLVDGLRGVSGQTRF